MAPAVEPPRSEPPSDRADCGRDPGRDDPADAGRTPRADVGRDETATRSRVRSSGGLAERSRTDFGDLDEREGEAGRGGRSPVATMENTIVPTASWVDGFLTSARRSGRRSSTRSVDIAARSTHARAMSSGGCAGASRAAPRSGACAL